MSKKNELKVFYYITKGPKCERLYKNQPPFFFKYTLEPNQTSMNLLLIKQIIKQEINLYDIEEIRYYNPSKKGFVRIINKTSFPIEFKEITLQIQLKEQEPKELIELIKTSENLKSKLEEYENIKIRIKNALDKEKIDLYFLYAFPLEESKGTELDSIITYHLEISKIVGLFKSSKKSFNALFESANVNRLKDVIREEPKVLHISCHGNDPNDDYYLKFEDKGQTRKLTEKELDKKLSESKDILKKIDLVILSSCFSEVAGELFFKYGVKNVIYIKKNCKISNKAALMFANSFYKKLIERNNVKNCFDSTIKEIHEQELSKINYKCCCKAHGSHKQSCFLFDKEEREKIHNELCRKICECNYDEFCFHNLDCSLFKAIKKWNKDKKKYKIKKVDDKNYYKICCGCDEDKEDMHHIGESFKFIYKAQNKDCEDKIIYKDNKAGVFKKNKNCIVITDKEMYKDIFLLLIDRRDKVKIIYDIIEKNLEKHFIIIYGEEGVGKNNFAKAVCACLFERNVINKLSKDCIKRARSIDIIKGVIKNKIIQKNDEKMGKYVFIIEIDYELQTPINLVNEIINEPSILDQKFYFFILFRTKEDKIELNQKKEKFELIHLENLDDPKALQLMIELRDIFEFEKHYLTDEQLLELIKLINHSRKDMLPLLKLIEHHNNYEEAKKELLDILMKKRRAKNEINNIIMETDAGKIIFILNIMHKGLPLPVLKLFDPNFENIVSQKNMQKFFYQINHINWRISRSDISNEDIIPLISKDKRKKWVQECLEIGSKILYYYNKNLLKNKQQNYFKTLDLEYYFYYFFEKNLFWKSFNNKEYELCFLKDTEKNISYYENMVKNKMIKIEDIKDNISNLFEVNNETIDDIYSENKIMKEYIEQIIIMLPRLFIKNKSELKIILDKFKNILKKMENVDIKNLLRLKLLYLWLQENTELNFDDFDSLDKEGKAYAYFINGLRIYSNILFHDSSNKLRKLRLNNQIDKVKESFEQAIKLFTINNTMKAYCYYHLGNLEYEQKQYKVAENKYIAGKSINDIDKNVKGLLNLKLAKLIIDNIPNNINDKQKFDEVIKDIMNIDDLWFINEAKELQKEIEEKLLPDIVLLSSNPLIKGENTSFNYKIQAAPNNQYYLMDKIFNRKDINTSLIIKYNVLNEDNLRETFLGKGKVLIIQSDDFNDEGDIFLESNNGKSYLLPNKYLKKINKINYDILILCFINSGKSIEHLQNKVKYLITFDANCKEIFDDIGNLSLLEYNKLSIDFLEHFIVNITKEDVKKAFDRAYKTFKSSFQSFCNQKTDSKFHEKIDFITFTVNQQGRVRKIENIINENGNKNIQFTPNPLLSLDIPLKFSYFSDYSNDISQIVKLIMNNYEKYYHDINIDKKKKAIEINVFVKNDKEIYISENIKLKIKQLIGSEILRFFYRHHEIFNSTLFKYFRNIKSYINNLTGIKKLREQISSGIGLIIIIIKQKKKNKKSTPNNIQTIPGFIYLYLSKDSMTNPIKNFEVTIKGNYNEYFEESYKRKRSKKSKRKPTNYQKSKVKNLDIYSNSKSNINLPNKNKSNNTISQFSLSEPKLKSYENEDLGFTIFDHEKEDDEDDDKDDNDDDSISSEDYL